MAGQCPRPFFDLVEIWHDLTARLATATAQRSRGIETFAGAVGAHFPVALVFFWLLTTL